MKYSRTDRPSLSEAMIGVSMISPTAPGELLLGFVHQAAHTAQLLDLVLAAPSPGIFHDKNRVEPLFRIFEGALDSTRYRRRVACVQMSIILLYRSPSVMIPLAYCSRTLFDLAHRLVDDFVLFRRYDDIIHGDGHPGQASRGYTRDASSRRRTRPSCGFPSPDKHPR